MKKLLVMFLLLTSCTYNVDYVKSVAADVLRDKGYEIVNYEGYQGFGSFCGGDVWYVVKRADSPVLYNLYLCKWDDEVHIYSIRALNAIGPK